MKELFKEITCNEMTQLLNQSFLGKKFELCLSSPWLINTYHYFDYEYDSINEKNDVLVIYDRNIEYPQKIRIDLGDIVKILYSEGKTIFDTTFSMFLKDNRIDFCVAERELCCCKCGRVINLDPFASIWNINGVGNYGDKYFDGDNLKDVPLCSDCLAGILGIKDDCLDEITS
jgi:hypothetical protein